MTYVRRFPYLLAAAVCLSLTACSNSNAGMRDGGPNGTGCGADRDCDDRVACTDDTCSFTGDCVHVVVPARCEGGSSCHPQSGCVVGAPCAVDADCRDEDPCTVNESCDSVSRTCGHELLDGDGDGQPPRVCGGSDCDDSDSDVAVGQPELCGNAQDDDCDGLVDLDATTVSDPDLLNDGLNCGMCGNACGAGRTCAAGSCVSCGGIGEPCCAGSMCAGDGLCSTAGCVRSCGALGEPCCVGDNACGASAFCGGGIDYSICRHCGDAGEPCCQGDDAPCGSADLACELIFRGNDTLYPGECTPCGGSNQPCCDRECETDLECWNMEGVGLFTTKVTFICRSPSCGGIGEPCCDGGCDFHNTCDSQNVCRGCGGRCNGCGGFPNPIYVSEPCCPYPDNGSNGLFESGCATGFVSSNATGACICNSFF